MFSRKFLKNFAGMVFREWTFSGVKKGIYLRDFVQNSWNSWNFLPVKISSLKVLKVRGGEWMGNLENYLPFRRSNTSFSISRDDGQGVWKINISSTSPCASEFQPTLYPFYFYFLLNLSQPLRFILQCTICVPNRSNLTKIH